MQPIRPVLIVVRDGWGVRAEREGNAVALARTPRHDELWARYPTALVNTCGHWVGLPDGQMGNSEVGHLNMGAGRVVYQDLARIEKALREGELARNPAVLEACARAEERDRALHLFGLVSDGGVHSHVSHLKELLRVAKAVGVREVYVHAILDGRDTDPRSGLGHLRALVAYTQELGLGRVATVAGRYYTMDRDQRWERVKLGYEAMVAGKGPRASCPVRYLEDSYAADKTDEFVVPGVVVGPDGAPVGAMRRGDQLFAFNFRADRMRQVCRALACHEFQGFERGHDLVFELAAMTRYDDQIPFRGIAFAPVIVSEHISEYVSALPRTQFKCAETEKYAHVTYFWNGGVEAACPGEERKLIPSPKVATYDLCPEMKAREVADATCARLREADDALVVLNFANTDMVGHTGVLDAAIHAVEAVDEAVGRVVEAMLAKGGCAIVTADHGNCEMMIDPETGGPHTAHTTNPVHAIVCAAGVEGRRARQDGVLADIAPTALELMGLRQPAVMTGKSLLAR